MRVYLFFSALVAAGISYAADGTPLRTTQWAHTTRAYCASVAPAPCVPRVTIVVTSGHAETGYRLAVTYKPSNPALPPATHVLYGDQIGAGHSNTRFQGAIVQFDPCPLDSGDIAIQMIEATPVTVSGPTIQSPESAGVTLY